MQSHCSRPCFGAFRRAFKIQDGLGPGSTLVFGLGLLCHFFSIDFRLYFSLQSGFSFFPALQLTIQTLATTPCCYCLRLTSLDAALGSGLPRLRMMISQTRVSDTALDVNYKSDSFGEPEFSLLFLEMDPSVPALALLRCTPCSCFSSGVLTLQGEV